jgi:hypothetical protein
MPATIPTEHGVLSAGAHWTAYGFFRFRITEIMFGCLGHHRSADRRPCEFRGTTGISQRLRRICAAVLRSQGQAMTSKRTAHAPFPDRSPTAPRCRANDHLMDTYRQASAHMIRNPRTAILRASTPEERATYRRWACTVLACYCLLFVWGYIAVLANHSIANSGNQAARASSQKNFSTRAGR